MPKFMASPEQQIGTCRHREYLIRQFDRYYR
jgi:hypothetical protein